MSKSLLMIVSEGIIVIFLLSVGGGLWVSATGDAWRGPLPWLVGIEQGMMSPFQWVTRQNTELVAEAQRADGSWERIDLDRYVPEGRAWRLKQQWIMISRNDAAPVLQSMAQNLLRKERAAGFPYVLLRLIWETWPVSPLGRETVRDETHTTRRFLSIDAVPPFEQSNK